MRRNDITHAEATHRWQLASDLRAVYSKISNPTYSSAERQAKLREPDLVEEYFLIRRSLSQCIAQKDYPTELFQGVNLEAFWQQICPEGCSLEDAKNAFESLFTKLTRDVPIHDHSRKVIRNAKNYGVRRKIQTDWLAKLFTDSSIKPIFWISGVLIAAALAYATVTMVHVAPHKQEVPKPTQKIPAKQDYYWKPFPKPDPNDKTIVKGS